MAHRWDIGFARGGFSIVCIKIFRLFLMLWHTFQSIDITIAYGAKESAVQCVDNHDLRAFAEIDLAAVFIQNPVICVAELDAMAAVHSPLVYDRQKEINFLIRGLLFENGFDMMDRQREVVIELLYVGVQEGIGSFTGGDTCQAKLDWQARLKRLIQPLHPSLSLRYAGCLQFNTELLACVGKLCEGILVQGRGAFLFVCEDCALVRQKLEGDAVIGQNLAKYLIIAIQSLLRIEPGSGDPPCRIVYRQMEMPDLAGNPLEGGGIHLLQLSKIGASGTPGMGVFDSNQVLLNLIRFLFAPSLLLPAFQVCFDTSFLGFRYPRRENILCLKD